MAHPIEPILLAFTARYGELSEQLVLLVLQYLDNGMTAVQAVNKALTVVDAPTEVQKAIEKTITASAAVGAGVESIPLLPALTYAWDPSGMKLSQKLHSAAAEMRRKIIDTIETQQKLNKGAIEVARELYDGYNSGKRVIYPQKIPQYLDKIYAYARRSDLSTREQEVMLRLVRRAQQQTEKMGTNGAPNQALKTAYKQLLQSVDKSISLSLEKVVRTAIEEKSRYVAERIARTESARAWADAFLARYDADDSVAAYQWKLSSRHPVFDICDMYAKANLWGLGPGVFPKDKVPVLPAHPHCLCHLALVYPSEIADKVEKNRIKQGGDEWLEKKTHAERCEVLGINGAHAWESGSDWRRYMRGRSSKNTRSRINVKSFQKFLKNSTINTGARILNPDTWEAMLEAEKKYEDIRKNTEDVEKISIHTGYGYDDILKIKKYLFLDKHQLGDNRYDRFDADYAIAESWKRLTEGKSIQRHDLVLLRHEILEKQLMDVGLSQDEAHREASRQFDYNKEVKRYYADLKANQ